MTMAEKLMRKDAEHKMREAAMSLLDMGEKLKERTKDKGIMPGNDAEDDDALKPAA